MDERTTLDAQQGAHVRPEPDATGPVDEDDPGCPPGTVLGGRYRIERRIGCGGSSTVYLAEHLALRIPVAVKVLQRRHGDGSANDHRFVREARVVARVIHPNVVRMLDVGRTRDGRSFLVMEHLQGEDLAEVLDRDGALPWPRARRILRRMIHGLRAAHAIGVIHRDVKPSNVFLVDAGEGRAARVKLLDFGIAKACDPASGFGEDLTGFDEVVGTADYVAPERILGDPADVRSDIYSLGVVMFEMLTGRTPWPDAGDLTGMLRQRVTEAPPSLPEVLPGLPSEMVAVVRRAMARDPADRFATLSELEAALPASATSARPRAAAPRVVDAPRLVARPRSPLRRWAHTLMWRGGPPDRC